MMDNHQIKINTTLIMKVNLRIRHSNFNNSSKLNIRHIRIILLNKRMNLSSQISWMHNFVKRKKNNSINTGKNTIHSNG